MQSIRGAITVEENTKESILENTEKLLRAIVDENDIIPDNIVSIIFTATKDLDKVYPAAAARQMGILDAALMCYQELEIENSLEMCIRCMVTVDAEESGKEQRDSKHIYLKGEKILRPDLLY